MVLVMGLVGLISSILLVGTYQLTMPQIERNKAEALEQAIFDVIPGARQRQTFVVSEEGGLLLQGASDAGASNKKAEHVYAGYDSTGALVGVAIEGSGQGFQDVLGLIFGYSPECACVVGMKVLETKETPGLGDKIEKDPAFLENLSSLGVELNSEGTALRNPVELVKKGQRTEKWQIEAISGATISSTAVAKIMDRYANKYIPIIERNLDVIVEGKP